MKTFAQFETSINPGNTPTAAQQARIDNLRARYLECGKTLFDVCPPGTDRENIAYNLKANWLLAQNTIMTAEVGHGHGGTAA